MDSSSTSMRFISTRQRARMVRAAATGAVAIAAALTALMASAQVGGANPAFEGRPAMAGAQGGTGAVAGPPQGGLGVQDTGGQGGVMLRRPSGLDTMGAPNAPAAQVPGGPALPAPSGPAVPRDPGMDKPGGASDLKPRPADSGIAKESRSAGSKARRIVKKPRE